METKQNETSLIKIKEIFTSIQGEGPYIGVNQLFIRFCKCNLNCAYCDTDYYGDMVFSPVELNNYITNKLDTVHSISLTGGEPLLFTKFLKEFLPLVDKKIYLETNATLYEALDEVVDLVDIISADIKLPSATGMRALWKEHDKFFEHSKGKEIFAKIVFNESITDDEIENCVELAIRHQLELILQPQTIDDKCSVSAKFSNEILTEFLKKYSRVRLIPQVHKFLGVE
ncbi:7-carboxy-7-deazaguanine synthase QueE [bacterium]|nr:7-carboxy-7-deazaguanine synthase QueE [bacterium]